MPLSAERTRLQERLLLQDTAALQSDLRQQLITGYVQQNQGQFPKGEAVKVIDRASIIMADSAHKKAIALSSQLNSLSDIDFAKTILTAAHDGVSADPEMVKYKNDAAGTLAKTFSKSYDPDLFFTLTGCKDGGVDPNSPPCRALLASIGENAPALPPTQGTGQSSRQQNGESISPDQMFGNLYVFYNEVHQDPNAAQYLLSLKPSDVDKMVPSLADQIQKRAKDKYNIDVSGTEAAAAANIMATQFATWGNHYRDQIAARVAKDQRPLDGNDMNELLSVLATNTRTEMRKHSAELGKLGSDEAIDALIGTGNRDDNDINVTNIGQIVLSEYRGNPQMEIMAHKKAIDALSSTGKLTSDAINEGIDSLPSTINSNDGLTLQITDTTKNFLNDAAVRAKKSSYDEGFGASIARFFEAIWAFISSLVCDRDFSKAGAAFSHVFDSGNIEHQNREQFAANYARIVGGASATELGFSGDPSLLDGYKKYLVSKSLTRMNESAAGIPSMDGPTEVSRTQQPGLYYYPGVDPAPLAGQMNSEFYKKWAEKSQGDADQLPIYIYRGVHETVAVETLTAATDGTGQYQIDPAIKAQVMEAAKQAAANGKVLMGGRDFNKDGNMDADELYAVPKADIKAAGTGLEIAQRGPTR